MTKREVFQLLKLISVYYDPYEINQEKVNQWFTLLKDDSYSRLEKNLRQHVAHSPYAPRISDLIRTNGEWCPGHTQTMKKLVPFYNQTKPASEEVVQQSLAKIREILGIQER